MSQEGAPFVHVAPFVQVVPVIPLFVAFVCFCKILLRKTTDARCGPGRAQFPLVIPRPIGLLSANFGKDTFGTRKAGHESWAAAI